jgi:hypothetical protein
MSRNFQVVSMCRKGNGGLARQMQQGGRVLADRIHQHRPRRLRRDLPQDVDAFGFQLIQMRWARVHHAIRCSAITA